MQYHYPNAIQIGTPIASSSPTSTTHHISLCLSGDHRRSSSPFEDRLTGLSIQYRDALNASLEQLTEEQARASLVASRTTLLGLVKHAIFVEKVWFDEAITGRSRPEIGIPATPDESFILDKGDTPIIELPGFRMHVTEAGQGEPVLLLHGFTQHWWEWRKIIPQLAEQYRVICPDLRGAGWTDAPAAGYGRTPLLSDVGALLDALSLQRVHIIAHDWGAPSVRKRGLRK